MSSNIEIKKSCQYCGKSFIAKKTSTKFCSLQCGQRNYKVRQRLNKIESSQKGARDLPVRKNALNPSDLPDRNLLGLPMLAHVTSLSARTIYRLMKDSAFPRIKVGRRTLFDKGLVVDYLREKFGVGEVK